LSTAKPTILHMLTAAPNLSPFDVNMAIDAGWQHCIPYTAIGVDQVQAYTQDAIFSRGPKGVKHTGLFIGGRDIHLAMDMLEAARKSMVPPFEVSVFADPSGAFTTAAGMVACAERHLRASKDLKLKGRRTLVFGGTGPVGSTCAVLAAQAGADVAIVSHAGADRARQAAELCARRYGIEAEGVDGSNDAAVLALMGDVEVVFGAAAAGVQVLSRRHIEAAPRLAVACDVNAVPPEGIEGVGVMNDGVPIEGSPSGALGIGALAVGNVKYQTQRALLKRMLSADKPQYLHFDQAFEEARTHV
jgi:methylene-tetrahydromethanopterin dehydrogenase